MNILKLDSALHRIIISPGQGIIIKKHMVCFGDRQVLVSYLKPGAKGTLLSGWTSKLSEKYKLLYFFFSICM